MVESDFTQAIGEAHAKYESIAKVLDVDRPKVDIRDLETQAATPGLRDDPENAQKITSRLSVTGSQLECLNSASQRINDVEIFVKLGREESDQDSLDEAQDETGGIRKDPDQMEIQTLLNGEYDGCSAMVTIHPGAGDVDAADLAQMLLRVYPRCCEYSGFKAKVMGTSCAEEAGVKSATFQVGTPYVYGRLPMEGGTYYLACISLFDNQGRCQTSLTVAEVVLLIGATDHTDILDTDIRVNTYCSSGLGDQGVNATHPAVCIAHLPASIMVTMQDRRPQIQNRASAMAVLQFRLLVLRHEEEARKKKGLVGDIRASWGDQMRSYVLHPYQMARDLRTGHEVSRTQAMLDDDINTLIEVGICQRHEQCRVVEIEE